MKQFLIAIDQTLNTLIWIKDDGFGYADETVSARAWRLRERSSAWQIIDAIFFWQAGHCEKAYYAEVIRKHYPKGYFTEGHFNEG